jgi:hypothetical protein
MITKAVMIRTTRTVYLWNGEGLLTEILARLPGGVLMVDRREAIDSLQVVLGRICASVGGNISVWITEEVLRIEELE